MAKVKPRVKVPKKASAGEVDHCEVADQPSDGVRPAQGLARPAN